MARNSADIVLKYLVDAFRDASLDWLGLHDVRVLRAIPTELPEVATRYNGCTKRIQRGDQQVSI